MSNPLFWFGAATPVAVRLSYTALTVPVVSGTAVTFTALLGALDIDPRGNRVTYTGTDVFGRNRGQVTPFTFTPLLMIP